MIDFLKIAVFDKSLISSLWDNSLLNYHSEKEWLLRDWETIKCKSIKQYKGILFCLFENKLEILFKPHYYFNNNLHNTNDFSVLDCIRIVTEFIHAFTIKDLTALKIINLEYGLNILPVMDCKELITYFSCHGKNIFYHDKGLTYSKKSFKQDRKGRANTYKIIKVYNKGIYNLEYCDANTLRFEVKSKQAKYIRERGIHTIKDLLNEKVYYHLASELIKEFREVLILDNRSVILQSKKSTAKELEQIQKYSNPYFWFKLLERKKDKNGFLRHKRSYFLLLDKAGINIHYELENIISDKLYYLLAHVDKGNVKIETEEVNKENQEIKLLGEKGEDSIVYISGKLPNTTNNNSKYKRDNNAASKENYNCTVDIPGQVENRQCSVTKIDISMQRKGSRLLSHAGLRYYLEKDKELFEQVKNKYLPQRWKDSDLETQIKELAHNIRNISTNEKNRRKGKKQSV